MKKEEEKVGEGRLTVMVGEDRSACCPPPSPLPRLESIEAREPAWCTMRA